MNERYSDTRNVINSLRLVAGDVEGPASGRLTILDAGMATVVADTREQLKERNVWGTEIEPIDDNICTIKWEVPEWPALFLELVFHEKVVEEPLTLRPAGPRAIDAHQATDPTDLGPRLQEALSPLVREYDATFTFKGVEAASVANPGHYTDFEYEYSIDNVGPTPLTPHESL